MPCAANACGVPDSWVRSSAITCVHVRLNSSSRRGRNVAARDARLGGRRSVVQAHPVGAHVAALQPVEERVVHLEAPVSAEVEAHARVADPADRAAGRRAAVRRLPGQHDVGGLLHRHPEDRGARVDRQPLRERLHLPAPAAAALAVDRVAVVAVVERVGAEPRPRARPTTARRPRRRRRASASAPQRDRHTHASGGRYGRLARNANWPASTSLTWLRVRASSRAARAASSITR